MRQMTAFLVKEDMFSADRVKDGLIPVPEAARAGLFLFRWLG